MSGCPGSDKSGLTITRPARSSSTPVRCAKTCPIAEAFTPAAQRIVRAAMCSIVSPCFNVTSESAMSVTIAWVRTITPSLPSAAAAFADSSGGYGGNTRSMPSSSRIVLLVVSIARKSSFSTFPASSAIAPANSTPVGPPPTITNVIQARRLSKSGSRSAASNAKKTRRRISRASSTVFSPGATAAQ